MKVDLIGDTITLLESTEVAGIVIPAGFTFNGNSVPRLLWPLAGHPFRWATLRASCLHDYLYRYCQNRKYADRMYLYILQEDGVRFAKVLYWAVRLFGRAHHG